MSTAVPAAPPPLPLTRGQQAWRFAVAIVGGVLMWFAQFSFEPNPRTWSPLVDLILGVGAIVALTQRRRRPVAVALATIAATAASGMAVPASAIALVSLTTTRRWRWVGAAVVVGLIAVLISTFVVGDTVSGWRWVTVPATGLVVWGPAVALGLFASTRRALAHSDRERAATAEREQRAKVEQARLGERTRIAREMHDVLAHRISLLALHAGAMTYRDDLSRDELRDAAGVVEQNARQAMEDLRGVLGVLRDPTADPRAELGEVVPEPPQPTLADLPDLVQEARAAGDDIVVAAGSGVGDLGVGGWGVERWGVADLPVTVSRTAYRIVQEGLTNARKHAPGAVVRLELGRAHDGSLAITVTNAGGRSAGANLPGSGVGLIGLSERVAAVGGDLCHGLGADGSFVLRARLPVGIPTDVVVSS